MKVVFRHRFELSSGAWGIVAALCCCGSGLGQEGLVNDADERIPTIVVRQGKISADARRSIDEGTKFLLSAMRADGMLGADIGRPPDLSCTSIAGLALLSQGNTPYGGAHSRELRKILDAVLIMADWIPDDHKRYRDTTLVRRKIGLNADRFLAALFLSQVLGEAGEADQDIRAALEKLVDRICREQGKDGTWGDESWAPVLGTVLGWESLRASSTCGFQVDASATLAGEALKRSLEQTMNRKQGWMHDFYKNTSSVRVLYSLGYQDDPLFRESVRRTMEVARNDNRTFTQAGGEEYLALFLVTECFLHEHDETWAKWYPMVSEKIVQMQNKDGSWTGHHCITDRVFCTSAALLTLQAPYSFLPISNL